MIEFEIQSEVRMQVYTIGLCVNGSLKILSRSVVSAKTEQNKHNNNERILTVCKTSVTILDNVKSRLKGSCKKGNF